MAPNEGIEIKTNLHDSVQRRYNLSYALKRARCLTAHVKPFQPRKSSGFQSPEVSPPRLAVTLAGWLDYVSDRVILYVIMRTHGRGLVAQDVKVNKDKFDALLKKMLSTPPLPSSEVKVAKPKPKKSRRA